MTNANAAAFGMRMIERGIRRGVSVHPMLVLLVYPILSMQGG